MSRADEIAQGLREPSGALTFPLDAFEYTRGYDEAERGVAATGLTSPSYDLGRALYGRRQEATSERADYFKREDERADAAMRKVLPPEAYEEWAAKVAEIRATRKP